MALGGICGSMLGGLALANLQIDTVFLLFTILPAIQLLSCGLLEENSVGSKLSPLFNNPRKSHMVNGNASILDDDNLLEKKSNISTSRRKKRTNNSKKAAVDARESQIPEIGDSLALQWFHSLKAAAYSLCHAFKQPIILRPTTWFFLAHVTVPNLSTVMFYYQTEFLNLEASFLGTARVVGWLGHMLGTFIYNKYFKKMKLQRILMSAHIGLSLLSLLNECYLRNIR